MSPLRRGTIGGSARSLRTTPNPSFVRRGESRRSMTEIFNRGRQTVRRKILRNNVSEPERRLWYKLKGGQLNGHKFRRQCGIGPYIADFYSSQDRYVIEIDGDSHFDSHGLAYDKERDAYMEALGIRVMRFTNRDIMDNMDGVLQKLGECLSPPEPPPTPPS